MKHLHRAQELLNVGRLGFGVNDPDTELLEINIMWLAVTSDSTQGLQVTKMWFDKILEIMRKSEIKYALNFWYNPSFSNNLFGRIEQSAIEQWKKESREESKDLNVSLMDITEVFSADDFSRLLYMINKQAYLIVDVAKNAILLKRSETSTARFVAFSDMQVFCRDGVTTTASLCNAEVSQKLHDLYDQLKNPDSYLRKQLDFFGLVMAYDPVWKETMPFQNKYENGFMLLDPRNTITTSSLSKIHETILDIIQKPGLREYFRPKPITVYGSYILLFNEILFLNNSKHGLQLEFRRVDDYDSEDDIGLTYTFEYDRHDGVKPCLTMKVSLTKQLRDLLKDLNVTPQVFQNIKTKKERLVYPPIPTVDIYQRRSKSYDIDYDPNQIAMILSRATIT